MKLLLPLLAFVTLLLPSAGISQRPSVTPPTRPAHLTFYYWPDVANPQATDPSVQNSPIQMSAVRDPKTGHELYSFFDQRTQQRFRDGAQIKADIAKLTEQPVTEQPRARLRRLQRELHQWHVFLRNSPVILTEADLEPKSTAELRSNGSIAVSEVFTPQGTQKFSRFTKAHIGEITGIVVNDSILSAPYVMEPILDSQMEMSGGFSSLTEAKTLADGLNAAARQARKP